MFYCLISLQLASHKSHMSTLLTAIAPHDTSFTPSHLYLRTSYPHLPPRPAQDAVPLEGGRRRRAVVGAGGRGQLGGMLAVEALSPAKGRKRVREEEDPQPTPRRERESNTAATHRRGGPGSSRSRKCVDLTLHANMPPERMRRSESHTHVHPQVHRVGSPSAESVLSITSHPIGHHPASNPRPPRPLAPPIPQAVPRPAAPAPPPPEDGEPGDNDEQDAGRYCYCHGPSYGEMVGCDDDQCAFEWVRHAPSRCGNSLTQLQFHLTCVGLTAAPKAGNWYCDDCKVKRAGSKKGRSGKRRTGGAAGMAAVAGGARAGRGRL